MVIGPDGLRTHLFNDSKVRGSQYGDVQLKGIVLVCFR